MLKSNGIMRLQWRYRSRPWERGSLSNLHHMIRHLVPLITHCSAPPSSVFLPLQVCDRFTTFRGQEASVACRQMGLPLPARAVRGAYYGPGSGPTMASWPERIWSGCQGGEESLDKVGDMPCMVAHTGGAVATSTGSATGQ